MQLRRRRPQRRRVQLWRRDLPVERGLLVVSVGLRKLRAVEQCSTDSRLPHRRDVRERCVRRPGNGARRGARRGNRRGPRRDHRRRRRRDQPRLTLCQTDADCSNGSTCVGGHCEGGGSCGDGNCETGETCSSCAADCGPCSGIDAGSSCAAGQTDCNGTCADLSSDSANCGACGEMCPNAGTCTAGECSS